MSVTVDAVRVWSILSIARRPEVLRRETAHGHNRWFVGGSPHRRADDGSTRGQLCILNWNTHFVHKHNERYKFFGAAPLVRSSIISIDTPGEKSIPPLLKSGVLGNVGSAV